MRFKLAARFLLIAGMCVYLTSVDMLLREALAAQNSRIVFTSTRHHSPDVFVMDADGGNQERLTIKNARESHPTWSPDRTEIAYVSELGGGWPQIYVMDARGKGAIKLTDGAGEKRHLDWSPDGRNIAFTSWDGQNSPYHRDGCRWKQRFQANRRAGTVMVARWSKDRIRVR